MSNFENIKAMTVEELAGFLSMIGDLDGLAPDWCELHCPYMGTEKCEEDEDCWYYKEGRTVEEGNELIWTDWLRMNT